MIVLFCLYKWKFCFIGYEWCICMMVYCRKFSFKIGVKCLYFFDEVGIIWILILWGLILYVFIGLIVFFYFYFFLICFFVFCEMVEEDWNYKFSVCGFCFLMIFIDVLLFFFLFLLRDWWVYWVRFCFYFMKLCLLFDLLLWWVCCFEDMRYVIEIDDKCVSRCVLYIIYWYSERFY